MGRWEPNARGRLSRAALVLCAQQGYESTTVAAIAAAAGVTERTFYRHFADKADAIFPDNSGLKARLAGVAHDGMRAGQAPLDAALGAISDLAALVGEEPERALLSAEVIPQVPALVGRDLLRQRQLGQAIAEALVDGGTPYLEAHLAAETAVGIWRVALLEWVGDPDTRPLGVVVSSAAEVLRDSVAGPV